MIAFTFSRMAQAIPVLLAVGFIAFAMFAFVGDPVTIMLGSTYTEAEKAALITKLGLDQPFLVQYARFMWNALHGEFGISYRLARPVMELISERLPATLELAGCAAVLALAIGVPMGVYTGIHRTALTSRAFMVFSLIGVSLPTFLIGILLILIFSVWLGVLPSFGRGDVVRFSHWSTGFLTGKGLKALVLPAVTLGLFQMTLIMRLVRAEMLEVLRSDYVKFARARGLSDRAINFGHALRNTSGAGHHNSRAADRRHHRLLDRDRDGVSVARHGAAIRPIGAGGRYSGHGRLPDADQRAVRGHQPDCRSALLRRRSPVAGAPLNAGPGVG